MMAKMRVIALAFAMAGLLALGGCASAQSGSAAGSSASGSSAVSASSSSASSTSSASSSSAPTSVPSDSVLPESEWGDYFSVLGEDAVAFGQRVQTELPVEAYALWEGVGGGDPVELTDSADICTLFNALASANIAGEATMISTDDYTTFGFKFADGTGYRFRYDSLAVEVKEGSTWNYYALDASPEFYAYAELAKRHTMYGE